MTRTGRPVAPELADRRRAAREAQLHQQQAAKRHRRLVQLGVVGGVALVVIAIVASAVLIGARSRAASQPTVDTTVAVDGVNVPFRIVGSGVRVGPADAPARIDLWVDYSCPHCKEFEAENSGTLNTLIAGGKVSVTYHNIQVHTDYGTEGGSAAACVATHDPAHWVAFNPSLYANHTDDRDGWGPAEFRTFAAAQGVNSATLDCIAADTYTKWISTNGVDAAKQGVNGTPTMFINGAQSDTLSGQALVDKVNALAGR